MTGLPACVNCGCRTLVFRLRGEKGGPIVCPKCAGIIDEIYGPRHRRVIDLPGDYVPGGPAKTRPGELTLEVINAAVKLAHPDRHGPERLELATCVTAALTALRPYARSTPKPPEPPAIVPDKWPSPRETAKKSLHLGFPCRNCIELASLYYRDSCRHEWDKRWQQERDAENGKRQQRRARKRARQPAKTCVCGRNFHGKRMDGKYCSNACRQRAHRRRGAA
jgi:hypothetical protein